MEISRSSCRPCLFPFPPHPLSIDWCAVMKRNRYCRNFSQPAPASYLPRHRLGCWHTLACLERGGGLSPDPLVSCEPLVVESRARCRSKSLHKTHLRQLKELKIEVICEVKVSSKVKIRRFDVLGPGDRDDRSRFPWLKLRQSVCICIVKVWFEHAKKRSRSCHKRSL